MHVALARNALEPFQLAQRVRVIVDAKLIEALAPDRTGFIRNALTSVMTSFTTDRANVTVHAYESADVLPGSERFPVILLKPARGAACDGAKKEKWDGTDRPGLPN